MALSPRHDRTAARPEPVPTTIDRPVGKRVLSPERRASSEYAASLFSRAIRESGFSQEQVARALDMHRSTLRDLCDPLSGERLALGDLCALEQALPSLYARFVGLLAESVNGCTFERERREIERTARRAIAELEHVVRGLEER